MSKKESKLTKKKVLKKATKKAAKKKTAKKKDVKKNTAGSTSKKKAASVTSKKAKTKINDPGMWGPAVAGTVEENETYEENIIKESKEEINLESLGYNRPNEQKYLE